MLSFVFPSHPWWCWKCSFYVHDVEVMTEEIGLPIRKLPENASLYLVVGQTKTRKLLLTRLETKHNVNILWYSIMQFFTRKTWGCNIIFNSADKEILSVLSVPTICWQETTVIVKKKKKLYLRLLAWMPCCFLYSMGMLVFHACSNQKPFHKVENHW